VPREEAAEVIAGGGEHGIGCVAAWMGEVIAAHAVMFLEMAVPVGNSRSDILVVQSAQNRHGQRLSDSLDGTGDRRVLLQ
jgi:hypothetical protein